MCYFLYIASPLTLSEVRSMLPAGLTADLASSSHHETFRTIHPEAATVARILVGRCSCDLVRRRLDDPKDDERHLRERYRRLAVPRSTVIAALERHRRQAGQRERADWPGELSKFVAEHARNAGATLYYLDFCPDDARGTVPAEIRLISTSAPSATSAPWLLEATPMLVTRHR